MLYARMRMTSIFSCLIILMNFDEFSNFRSWAERNKVAINFTKSKEIVFRRPPPVRFNLPSALNGIEQVNSIKFLGTIL